MGRRLDIALGIALGLVLGVAIVFAFVFWGSEGSVDSPRVNGAGVVREAPLSRPSGDDR